MTQVMTCARIREAFLNFFQRNQHAQVPSSSLVPADDPTLLFTNAGMVQFKDVFLGREQRGYVRAASSQRCVRAGGKHNDLENVGYTARHHTFFEMLGNFSFGDYFKREAIHLAWEFLTRELAIPAEKLWVTVFEEDSEAENIWLNEIGVDPKRFSRIGAKDNFWSMGETGPCGPCSEIFYDHGDSIAGGPPGSPDEEGDRYVEIWNLVFMQYDRAANGDLTPLPKPSVDTGMGLERIAAVMQGVHSNYDIDLFKGLLAAGAKLAGLDHTDHSSLRVLADHIRSSAFLIADGVLPSNEGRGYVLRRIIRRAIRHGYRLGIREVFFYQLVAPLAEAMGEAYPELITQQAQIIRVLQKEEQRFAETLDAGMRILEVGMAKLSGKTIPGDVVFLLYDTYGFPVDLTADYAREHGLTIDHAGFETEMSAQKQRARAASQFSSEQGGELAINGGTEFTGYDHLEQNSTIVGLFAQGQPVDAVQIGEEGVIVLDQSSFYGESGGQVGDRGRIVTDTGEFQVTTTQKQGDAHLHYGKVSQGRITVNSQAQGQVDADSRQATARNHSATHLLHAALRKILGSHVTQKGSLVNSQRLRFDFAHFEPVSREQLRQIETEVNAQIRRNLPVAAEQMSKDQALEHGAMALFGEKYGDQVRVLTMGDFSIELCGGTHVQRTGDIGLCKIVMETGVASGVRRIEAITGAAAFDYLAGLEQRLNVLAENLKTAPEQLVDKVQQLLDKNRQLDRELSQLKSQLAASSSADLVNQAVDIQGIKVLAVAIDGADAKTLRELADRLRDQLGAAVVVLATTQGDKVSLIAAVSKAESKRLKAGELIGLVAAKVGGKGGGRPDMAQAGGNLPDKLPEALAWVPDWVKQQLNA
ncbi:MAG: alanine--tRNA ligase [Methylococcales bacterium]|nr:alanine--tRNA ligase [Methylococcales bacterium]